MGEFDLLETVREIPAADIEYECDHFEGDLGPYEPA